MATYKALIKTVPTGSAFEVTTESGSINTAKQQIEKLYDPIYIHNLREVRNSSSSVSESSSSWFLILAIFGIWLIVTYWWIVIPLSIIGLVGYLYAR